MYQNRMRRNLNQCSYTNSTFLPSTTLRFSLTLFQHQISVNNDFLFFGLSNVKKNNYT
jgi:hypothetical protein